LIEEENIMMGTAFGLIYYLIALGLGFLIIALGVKYGILWALRALSDDDLAKMGRVFKR
jgi:hypothetical protein